MLIFCLDDLSIGVSGVLKSLTIILLLLISPLTVVSICLVYWGTHMLGVLLLMLSHFSHVRLCATPYLGFTRQEHWSGLPFPSPMHKSEKWKWSRSVMSDSSRPRGLQPTRLLHPWDFPGKSTGVGCHCLLHNTLSRFVIAFLPRSKSLNFTAAVTVLSDCGDPKDKKCHFFHFSPFYLPWSEGIWSQQDYATTQNLPMAFIPLRVKTSFLTMSYEIYVIYLPASPLSSIITFLLSLL